MSGSKNFNLSSQNSDENIQLLQASTVAYKKAKRGEITITYFLLFLAIAYPLCYLFLNQQYKLFLFVCSFFITIIIQIFTDTFYGNTSKGAIFKEAFDVNVFGLPWKTTLTKPGLVDIHNYSSKYRGGEIKDWYSPHLSPSLPPGIQIAVLQHCNTSWDISLRRLYRQVLISFLMSYSIVLLALFLVKRVDALTIFLLLFSLLSFYIHFISMIRGHTSAIEKRQAICHRLDAMIHSKRTIELQELRDIQDEIYLTRKESAKVPDFFFRMYKDKLNAEAEKYISDANALYG